MLFKLYSLRRKKCKKVNKEDKPDLDYATRLLAITVICCSIFLAVLLAGYSGYMFALYLTDAPQYQSIDLILSITCMVFAIPFGIIVLGLRTKEDRSSNSNHLMPKL